MAKKYIKIPLYGIRDKESRRLYKDGHGNPVTSINKELILELYKEYTMYQGLVYEVCEFEPTLAELIE
jgi:hypothetical protein